MSAGSQFKKQENPEMHDIVFVNPPNHCREDYIPLGLMNIYTIAKNAGYKANLIDLQKLFISGELEFSPGSITKIYDIIGNTEAKIYAFTVWNTSFPWVTDICRFLKSRNCGTVTVVGGPLPTLASEEILGDYDCIDITCRFEGELVIEPLIDAILASEPANLKNIRNISYRGINGDIHSNENGPLVENLDTLARIEVTPEEFRSPVINLEAGRGCSFHCYYCSSCYIWQFWPRYKSGNRLFSEIEQICGQFKASGMTPPVFHLEHDNFLMKPEILSGLEKRIKETGLKFKYGFAGRADLITDKNLELLKNTGCRYAFLGIETGSVRMQKKTRKNLSFKKMFSAIKGLQNNNIIVNANLMYGFPEETLDDLYATLNMINTLRWLGVKVHVSMLSPEMKTAVGDAAPLTDYIFNESSRYTTELKKSGFDPAGYREIYLNHLYSLRNRYYDLPGYNRFILFWHELVTLYPMSAHAIMNIHDRDWDRLFSSWEGCSASIFSGDASQNSVMHMFRILCHDFGENEKEAEIAETEFLLARKTDHAALNQERMRDYFTYYGRTRNSILHKMGLQPALQSQH